MPLLGKISTNISSNSWAPTQASLEFTILDKLKHWVLRDDGYNADDKLPSLVNTEHESSAGNPPSPEPLDILSLLTRIWDNTSALYNIINHHPTLTLFSEQAHIQVLIKQVQSVINTLHNLQWLAESLRNIQSLLDPDFAEHCQCLHLLLGARELYESHRCIIRNGYKSSSDNSEYLETLRNFHLD
ncbi:hypothetical protein BD309DRAFT_995298 [Dichomitus squalens]|nr:hypothetical protein BD309DRAFT_995298 [Dichomitus squalens]